MDSVYIGNRGGTPVITVNPQVNTSNVIFALPNHIFRFAGSKGVFVLSLTNALPAGTTGTLPVVFQVNNTTLPLTNESGIEITAADITSTVVFTIYFDKQNNVIRVISPIS